MFVVFLLVMLCLVCFYYYELHETIEKSIETRELHKDGFVVMHNPNYSKTKDLPTSELEKDALSHLPDAYVLMDYVYNIHDSSLFTFHRDVTSSKHTFNTKHPTYTLILYKSDGCLLSLCPGSHSTYPFVWSRIVNIQGNTGTAFLFDSDLLHAGCINDCGQREVIQYKFCHKDDLVLLESLQGVRAIKKQTCEDTFKNRFMRKLTYYFEFPINYMFTPFMIKRYNKDTFIGSLQSFIPITYYNNA